MVCRVQLLPLSALLVFICMGRGDLIVGFLLEIMKSKQYLVFYFHLYPAYTGTEEATTTQDSLTAQLLPTMTTTT
jgi:hypothetical protein